MDDALDKNAEKVAKRSQAKKIRRFPRLTAQYGYKEILEDGRMKIQSGTSFKARFSLVAALFSFLASSVAWADEAGEREYMNSCASCHGADGKGLGPVATALSINIAKPLTGLSAANDGVFPMLEVIQIIDGRSGVRGHGTDAGMPVWGAVYKAPLVGEIGNYGTEAVVRGKILSLALYLESIQE